MKLIEIQRDVVIGKNKYLSLLAGSKTTYVDRGGFETDDVYSVFQVPLEPDCNWYASYVRIFTNTRWVRTNSLIVQTLTIPRKIFMI